MTHLELLEATTQVFHRLGLRYLVTGSTATILYGEPRFTNDLDVVVDLPEEAVPVLCREFPSPDFYLSEPAAIEAVRGRRQFNIIHPTSGLKIDVIVASDSDFDRSRLSRGRMLPVVSSGSVWVASPEDVIVKKLQYFREGGSDKHVRDIVGVLRIRGEEIDHTYLEKWIAHFGLEHEWQQIVDAA